MKLNTLNLKFVTLLGTALLVTSPAVSAAEAGRMAGMNHAAPDAAAQTGHAVGVVKAVNAVTKTVTIVTEAVPERSWPADMSMDYKVADGVALSVSAGQKVNFEFAGQGMDVTITRIEAAE